MRNELTSTQAHKVVEGIENYRRDLDSLQGFNLGVIPLLSMSLMFKPGFFIIALGAYDGDNWMRIGNIEYYIQGV